MKKVNNKKVEKIQKELRKFNIKNSKRIIKAQKEYLIRSDYDTKHEIAKRISLDNFLMNNGEDW